MENSLKFVELSKNLFVVDIAYSDIQISADKIVNKLGYNSENIPDHFSEMVNRVIVEFKNKNKIQAGFKIANSSINLLKPNTICFDDVEFNVDKIILSQIKRAKEVAVFLVTIGSEMEAWAKQCSEKGDSVIAYIIDLVASEAAEQSADYLHNCINIFAKERNQNITNRYSPGYCNWLVNEQKKLFTFFPDKFCGVELSESSLMLPIKSISGVIGLGENVKYNEYLCDKCGAKDCTQRVMKK